ncbi:MAG TPA: SGNH/GDSL hydrolase family protein [Bauldia sp.]|nr:SGNH/GDSL hydrolase family protein [Bauldia sp.]
MKTVLCYGDSNTWGYATEPRPDNRYGPGERWTGVLAHALGRGWRVIEEGLNGRTTVSDDPVEGLWKNGATYLLACLNSHMPLDAVVIMLGTNDLKARFGKSAWEVAQGAGVLVRLVRTAAVGRNGGAPEIVLVAPAPFRDRLPLHADMFAGAIPKSKELARHYKAVAELEDVHFFDAGSVMKSSKVDGFHLDPDAHASLGKALASVVKQLG